MTPALRLTVPRAAALAEVLAAPGPDAPPPGALDDLRAGLGHRLAQVAGPDRVDIDGYRLRGGPLDDGPFTCSPVRCRRTVASAALMRCLRGRPATPAAAVADVLDEAVAAPTDPATDPWWAPWYRQQAPAVRAVVRAEAVTWATELWVAVDWAALGRPPVVGGRPVWWSCPGARQLRLKARCDVRVQAGPRPSLLVVGGGDTGRDWRIHLSFPALVAGLAHGERALPVRVVGLWPATGQVRILPVELDALEACADAVVAVAAGSGAPAGR